MTPIVSFVLGLLFGWLVEWAIDWIYWRRRLQTQKAREAALHQRVVSLDRELVALKTGASDPEKARLQELVCRLEQELAELRARQPASADAVPNTPEAFAMALEPVPDTQAPSPAAPDPVAEIREPALGDPERALDASESVLAASEPVIGSPEPVPVAPEPAESAPEPATEAQEFAPDNLEAIKGIGPAIARKLNQAGIYTFEQLAAQTPASLRAALGSRIERLANSEGRLLDQARRIAAEKQGKGSGSG